MAIQSNLFFIVLFLANISCLDILPFSSIKILGNEILVATNDQGNNWMKFVSINNVTSQQIMNYSKQHFKENNCEMDCFKFHVINDFPNIYKSLSNKNLTITEFVVLEYHLFKKRDDKHSQKLFKLSSNKQKFELNKKFFLLNKPSKNVTNMKIFPEYKNMIFKSLGRNAEPLVPIFKKKINEKTEENIEKEINQIENEIKEISLEENFIKNNLSKDIKILRTDIINEKSLIKGLYKAEIIAGIIGGVMIASLIVFYYVFNGLVKESSFA